MRGIGTSKMAFIVMAYKYIQNVKVSIQITTVVKYMLVLNNRAIDLNKFDKAIVLENLYCDKSRHTVYPYDDRLLEPDKFNH